MEKDVTPYDLLEERLNAMEKARALQAIEYERRLDALNHENERIMEILKQSVPREVYDRGLESMNAKIQINTDFMNSVKGKGTGMNSLWVIGIAAVLGICAIVTMIIVVLSYFKK